MLHTSEDTLNEVEITEKISPQNLSSQEEINIIENNEISTVVNNKSYPLFIYRTGKILKIGIPLIGVEFIEAARNFTITMMLTRIDEDTLSAIPLMNTTKTLVSLLGGALLIPAAAIAAREYGAAEAALKEPDNKELAVKYKREIGSVIQQTWVLGTLIGIPAIAILCSIKPILISLGQSPELSAIVESHTIPFSIAFLPKMWLIADHFFLMGIGKQNVLIPWSIFNIGIGAAANYVLIFGKLGLPPLGAAGSGYAIAIEYLLSLAAMRLYYIANNDIKPYEILKPRLQKSMHYLKLILKQGYPIFLLTGVQTGVFFVQTLMVGWLGKEQLAIDQASQQFLLLFIPISTGIAQAGRVLVAKSVGQKNLLDIRGYGNTALGIELAVGLIPLIGYVAAPIPLAKFFLGEKSSIDIDEMETVIRVTFAINAIGQILQALQNASTFNLQGLYDNFFPSMINTLVTLALVLPLSYIMSFIAKWDLIGLDVAGDMSLAIGAGIILSRWFFKSQASLYVRQTDEEAAELTSSPVNSLQSFFIKAKNSFSMKTFRGGFFKNYDIKSPQNISAELELPLIEEESPKFISQ